MADIVLSPFLQVIFDRLASPVIKKFGDYWDLKGNFQKLQNLLPMVQFLLDDIEEQQVSNKRVTIWLSKLKSAVDDAGDMLNELAAKGVQNPFYQVLGTFSFSADKLRQTLQVLEMTVVEGLNLQLGEGSVGRPSDERETSSFVIESEVYGREEDKENIVKLLLSCDTTQGGYTTFIPIIGMGGLGKTTLAQLAYNDVRVTQHFDVKLWVFVSDDFNAKEIIKRAIVSATKRTCDFSDLDVLQSTLWGLLHKKRYLIVLDDVWSEKQSEWDKLRPLFRGGVDGSKIIVTTRSKKVELSIDAPTLPYYLKGLPGDDCWVLFKQRAFCQGEEKQHPNLLPIGKRIVKKCGGVPLAARAVGSLMRFKRTEIEWLYVLYSDLWNLDAFQGQILPALRLSYFHLPPQLRKCFAFCSVFPKSYEFTMSKLIFLWMAEDLILPDKCKEPEDIGIDFFNEFLWMSLFQEASNCNNGSIKEYRMHDIIHDLARSVTGDRSLILEHGLPTSSLGSAIRSSVVYDFRTATIPEALYGAKHLRTLLFFPGREFIEAPQKVFSSFKLLKVLDMSGCGIVNLDKSIGELKLLRYLDLSYAHMKTLPPSIETLSLQTLNLRNCYNLIGLPNIPMMPTLRHLILVGCEALTSTVPDYFRHAFFPVLQFLPVCIVGGSGDLELLGRSNVRDSLDIKRLENVRSAGDANKAKLVDKQNLFSLGLYWGNNDGDLTSYPVVEANMARFQEKKQLDSPGSSRGQHILLSSVQRRPPPSEPPKRSQPVARLGEEVIEGLQPHQNLKRLSVKGYPGVRFPQWTLPNLIVVDLANFKNCDHLPVLGNLPLLKTLFLGGMEAVKCIGMDFYGKGLENLKALESLGISDCHSIVSLPNDGIGSLSSLRTLSIENCSNLASLSKSFQHLMSLEHLTIMYCPSLGSLPEGVQHLSALRSLTILSCPEFLSLPEGLQYVTTLQCLEIGICHGLKVLPEWVENLASLRSLTISDCQNLKYLPEGLKFLSALQHLSIQDCPELQERCKQESGEDWPKIAHIPHKKIGSPLSGQSGTAGSSSG